MVNRSATDEKQLGQRQLVEHLEQCDFQLPRRNILGYTGIAPNDVLVEGRAAKGAKPQQA